MLTIIRSPMPGILQSGENLPGEAADLLKRLEQRPQRFVWIVPTGRRKRALGQEWLKEKKAAAILPKLHTLESFVSGALEYSVRQQRQIGGPERILRLARAWQEITGRAAGAGLIHQLDRFVRDWQACGLPVPDSPSDDFERLIVRQAEELARDGCLDRMGSIAALIAELCEGQKRPLFLRRIEAVFLDGFHRLERLELELIAALARHSEVLLWMVGVPGQRSWRTVEEATQVLQDCGGEVSVIDHAPKGGGGIAELGRRLFQVNAKPQTMGAKPQAIDGKAPAIFKLECASTLAEVEAVAKQIKKDFVDSQAGPRPLRLSDIAVVIPGPGYDPLVREAFPRAGLEFNLAGRALLVSTSRPARVLTAAVQVVRGQWRHDLLFDFLNHPLVKLRLKEGHRLYELFEHRPRARRRLDYRAWTESWKQFLARLKSNIEDWKTGRLELPERVLISREDYVQMQSELAESLERLIASIHSILERVAAIDRLVGEGGMLSPPSTRVIAQPGRTGGESMAPIREPMRELIQVLLDLLRVLEIGKWLTPPSGQPLRQGEEESPVLWVEYEKDQQAYFKLLSILETLKDLPAARLPRDPVRALELALDGETYQIKTEDDAGVQVIEMREIRGLRFRQVYMLGLVNGQVPALPEEGMLVTRRRNIPPLNEQLRQKEAEAEYLFSQLFEAAEEKLLLSRPTLEGDQKTLPSPFLTAVEGLVDLAPVNPPELVVSMREAASVLGRAAAAAGWHAFAAVKNGSQELSHESGRESMAPLHLSELWIGLDAEQEKYLEPVLAGLTDWQQKPRPEDLAVDWPELWQVLFPDDHLFSASQLETYAACPFRFFGKQVLRLEEREPDQTRMHYGSLVHRVLHRFYAERRQISAWPEDKPLPAVGNQDKTRLVELFREEWDCLDEGAIPPDLEKLFCCSGGVLDLFFEVMDSIEGENLGNLATELALPRILLGKTTKAGRCS